MPNMPPTPPDPPTGSGNKWTDLLNSVGGLDQIFNLAQFITGMEGTKQKLPEYKASQEFKNLLSTYGQYATQGYTPQETAQFRNSQDRSLAAGFANIRNISGGNSAFGMGASEGVINDYNKNNLDFAANDAALRRDNLGRYGNMVLTNEGFRREDFGRKYNEAMMTKTAAGQLAHTGFQATLDQPGYNKYQSAYLKYIQSLTDAQNKANAANAQPANFSEPYVQAPTPYYLKPVPDSQDGEQLPPWLMMDQWIQH
jgi:hypothetical protein